jgi:glyoxylase-like metal-dependent hydrolase (beta-lactamase superfamily II)
LPHGSLRIGRVEVLSLCDGVTLAGGGPQESFPGVRDDVWAASRERYPWAFGPDDSWRLHVHASLLRSQGHTILVDTGVGPESAPAFAWSKVRGALPEELADAGVDVAEVEQVVITHVHDDHLGWTTAETSEDPLFPNARYLIHRADWELMADAIDEEDLEIFAATMSPLERAGLLQLTDGRLELSGELTLLHAPGHTPGHQVVAIDSDGQRAIVSGDLVNNPVQLHQPGLNGSSDADPDLAASTRAAWLEAIAREDRIVIPSHFQEGFGRFVVDGDAHVWQPLAP